jgi:mannose-6-phosphate isomerase
VSSNFELRRPFQLFPNFEKRVWGRESLAPYFENPTPHEKIGEAWFTSQNNRTSLGITLEELLASHGEILGTACHSDHPGVCPLLLKFLFTSERLSVQVHPDDDYARRHHQCLGKTEAWYVLDSQPPGEVGVGFSRPLSPEELTKTAHSGEIEDLVGWRQAKRGDVIFVPAGTVHAIGAGLTICEIQENSDITYRLYDYGRPRELHLEHGARVSETGVYENAARKLKLAAGREELLVSKYFRLESIRPQESIAFHGALPYYALLICTAGKSKIQGQPVTHGQVWFVPAGSEEFEVVAPGSEWLLTYTSEQSAPGLEVH